MACGVIYLVPVPIGNLADITLRAIDTLKQASLIACEDTRKTAFLLHHYNIPVPKLVSFHKFNERQREELLIAHLENGQDLVVVSDAGSPGISDPSGALVQAAIQRQIPIIALPGPNALIPAISTAGMNTHQFQFVGFLPATSMKRQQKLKEIAPYPYPCVIYEAPHRLLKTLNDIFEYCGNRRVCLCREISKLYEEHLYGTIEELLNADGIKLKGEFVIVLDGCVPQHRQPPTESEIDEFVIHARGLGLKTREISGQLCDTYHLSRSEAYNLVLQSLQRIT